MKKYILTFIFCLIAVNAFGATRLYKTVKPSGGDYTSLEACMNANEQNLVTADKYFDVEIDGSWSSADTTACMIHNYTTDATRYINIYTTSAARHLGVWNASKYILASATTGITSQNTVFIAGIQVLVANTRVGIYSGWDSIIVTVQKCIIKGGAKGIYRNQGGYSASHYAYNNIIYNCTTSGISCDAAATSVDGANRYYNNTIYGCGIGIVTDANTDGTLVKNNICYNNTTDYSLAHATVVSNAVTNLSKDNTSPNAALRSKTLTFTNTGAGTEDFHLVVGDTDAINHGTDLSSIFTDDIDGTTRPTRANTWDIGADEYVAPAGGAVGQVIMISD